MKKFLVVLELSDGDWNDIFNDRIALATWIAGAMGREAFEPVGVVVYDDDPLSLHEAILDLGYDPEEVA